MLLNIIRYDEEAIKAIKESDDSKDKLLEDPSSSLRMKIIICSTMLRMLRTLREEQELIIKLKGFCPGNKIPKGILLQGADALKTAYERYTRVKSMDAINEKRPKSDKK